MRTAFSEALLELAEHDPRIWLICGDLGFSVLERFAERFPARFVNVGVAEQNMTGLAAGLALCGKVVFTYSIANFPVTRCLEQIRNDVCYHNLNVKIVAVGGGFAYGSAGYSHHAVELFALMRSLPNMVVLAPGDPVEARLATQAAAAWSGPCFLQLGKAGEPIVHREPPPFEIGAAITLRDGSDVTLIGTGGALALTAKAADELAQGGRSVQVLSMPTLQPLDRAAIVRAAERTGRIVTVEEHGLGGLGSAVAETLAGWGRPVRFTPLRLTQTAVYRAAGQDALRAEQGISIGGIIEAASRD
ncbi:MAG: transketolase [Chloroflexi bacterium]|nr:transketolase [Chloroflexota bacterium]